jgi:hypothetical protein
MAPWVPIQLSNAKMAFHTALVPKGLKRNLGSFWPFLIYSVLVLDAALTLEHEGEGKDKTEGESEDKSENKFEDKSILAKISSLMSISNSLKQSSNKARSFLPVVVTSRPLDLPTSVKVPSDLFELLRTSTMGLVEHTGLRTLLANIVCSLLGF